MRAQAGGRGRGHRRQRRGQLRERAVPHEGLRLREGDGGAAYPGRVPTSERESNDDDDDDCVKVSFRPPRLLVPRLHSLAAAALARCKLQAARCTACTQHLVPHFGCNWASDSPGRRLFSPVPLSLWSTAAPPSTQNESVTAHSFSVSTPFLLNLETYKRLPTAPEALRGIHTFCWGEYSWECSGARIAQARRLFAGGSKADFSSREPGSTHNISLPVMGDHDQQWGKYAGDYNSGVWLKDVVETPFLVGHFQRFAQKASDRGEPWKALDIGCGVGKYTVRLLQAGASYVVASDAAVDMVKGAKKETEQYLIGRSGPGIPKADFHVCSAAHLTSIPGIEEGTFDLAISIYVLCNLPSKEDVKQALVEISKLLRPGGTFVLYEPHIVEYMTVSNSTGHVEYLPKEDGTEYKYFEDEGTPRTLRIRMNSGTPIEITNRFYTLSFWVTSLLEAGFQISQFHEPHGNPKDVPSDAPSYMRYYAEWPSAMVWLCTKVSQ